MVNGFTKFKERFQGLGIRGTDKQKMTEMLYRCYGLKDNT